jgi:sulfur carrier protein ThiS
VKLEIRLFAGLQCNNPALPCLGKQEFFVNAPDGITVKGLHELLQLGDRPLVTVVNGAVEKKDFVISDNDRVGIFPPIAGGQHPALHMHLRLSSASAIFRLD